MIWYRENEVKQLLEEAYKRGRAVGWSLGNQNRISLNMERQKLEIEMEERRKATREFICNPKGEIKCQI